MATEALKAYKAAWYQANKTRIASRAAQRYAGQRFTVLARAKDAYAADPERKKRAARARYASLPKELKERVVARAAAHDKANPDQAKARTSLRRKRHQQATPPWLTLNHKRQIKRLYVIAAWITSNTSIPHHVDHVVPLSNPLVCGLHAPWNLQVLPYQDNLKKSNRVWPDMP